MLEDSVSKLKRLQNEVTASLGEDAPAGSADAALPSRLARFVHFWSLVGRFFWRNRCQVRASALAYTTLLALVPLLAVSLTVASLVFDAKSEASRAKLTEYIGRAIDSAAPMLGLVQPDKTEDDAGDGTVAPALPKPGQNPATKPKGPSSEQRAKIADTILDFVGNIKFGTIGVTATAGLIFVAISLLRTIESAFNDIWGVTKGRGWFDSIILYWAAISLGPIALLVATTSGYLSTIGDGVGWISQVPGAALFKTQLLPLVVMSLAFGCFYKFMPNTPVRWRPALVGGAVAGILWWLNNRLGALYNTKVVMYSKIYGSLGVVPLFLVGMYFSWLIVLFGSEVAYVFQNRHAYLQERISERVHQRAREFIALRFMTEIGHRFVHDLPAPSAPELAASLAVPARLTGNILTILVQAHLASETIGVEPGYVPGRPLDRITARDILGALRTANGADLATTTDEHRPVVAAEFAAIQAAESSRSSGVTLESMVAKLPA